MRLATTIGDFWGYTGSIEESIRLMHDAGFRYIEPSLLMRTERILAMTTSPEQRAEMLKQERLQDAFTIDLSLSKSIYLNRLSKKIYSTSAAHALKTNTLTAA